MWNSSALQSSKQNMRLNKLLPRFGEHTVLWCRANVYFVLKSFWQSHLHLSNDLPTDLLFFAAIALTKQVDLIRFNIIYNFSRLKMTARCVSLAFVLSEDAWRFTYTRLILVRTHTMPSHYYRLHCIYHKWWISVLRDSITWMWTTRIHIFLPICKYMWNVKV